MHNWLIGYYIVEFEMTIPSPSIAEQGDSLYDVIIYLRRALSDFKNLRSFALFTNTTSGLSRTALTRLLLSKAILPFVLLELLSKQSSSAPISEAKKVSSVVSTLKVLPDFFTVRVSVDDSS